MRLATFIPPGADESLGGEVSGERVVAFSGGEAVVAFLGETCTLEPGDVILTGTPSGVGMSMDPPRFLASGDVVRIEIERLGAIEHAVA